VADPSVDWTDAPWVREIYLRHWRYNRADPFQMSFLATTPMYSQWDDHEVINDFGAPWAYWNSDTINRAGYPNLVAAGREAFFDYSPIDRDPVEPDRVYRSFRWGRHVELFLLDGRSYRDRNDLPDTPENHKTLLGAAQLAWLEDGLRRSTATWKIVSSDTTLSAASGSVAFGRDSFANIGAEPTGFERELLTLLAQLDRDNVRDVVFVATDVHFAQTIRYRVDADGDGDVLDFHELVSGPLNAIRLTPGPLDPAASPASLFAEGGLFNYEYVRVRADGHLLADVRGADGAVRPGSELSLTP
jgi:alkaline phosphatase D